MSKPFKELRDALKTVDMKTVNKAAEMIITSLKKGGKLITFGNGGSATDADHLASELMVRYKKERRPLPAISLTNPAILTAAGNDYGYGQVFARPLNALLQPNDVIVAISTSGRSGNVNTAVMNHTGPTIYLTGAYKGEDMTGMDALFIHIPSTTTSVIQDCHRAIIHHWCEKIDREFCDA